MGAVVRGGPACSGQATARANSWHQRPGPTLPAMTSSASDLVPVQRALPPAGLAWFNALPATGAQAHLFSCFASRRWAQLIEAARPYRGFADLLGQADLAWDQLTIEEWLESFA